MINLSNIGTNPELYQLCDLHYESNVEAEIYHQCKRRDIPVCLGVQVTKLDKPFYTDVTACTTPVHVIVNNFDKTEHRTGIITNQHRDWSKKVANHINAGIPTFYCGYYTMIDKTVDFLEAVENKDTEYLYHHYPNHISFINNVIG